MKRTSIRLSATMLALVVLASISVFAQDAGQVLQLSVGFRTMKNRVPMSEEKRKEVEALETKARAANNATEGARYSHRRAARNPRRVLRELLPQMA